MQRYGLGPWSFLCIFEYCIIYVCIYYVDVSSCFIFYASFNSIHTHSIIVTGVGIHISFNSIHTHSIIVTGVGINISYTSYQTPDLVDLTISTPNDPHFDDWNPHRG